MLKFTVLLEIPGESLPAACICYCILWCVHIQSCDHTWIVQVRLSKPLPTAPSWLEASLSATLQSFAKWAFSSSYLFDPVVAVAQEAHVLALAVWFSVSLVCPWFSPSRSLNVFFFSFLFNFLKKVHWNSWLCRLSEGHHKRQVTAGQLLAKEQDISHNRSTDFFL